MPHAEAVDKDRPAASFAVANAVGPGRGGREGAGSSWGAGFFRARLLNVILEVSEERTYGPVGAVAGY